MNEDRRGPSWSSFELPVMGKSGLGYDASHNRNERTLAMIIDDDGLTKTHLVVASTEARGSWVATFQEKERRGEKKRERGRGDLGEKKRESY
uniref:Uncharacterized protein n=1 Tax=Cannabis sativa TaxID=3483 RepID=A0A803PVV2_CANSA